MTIHGEPEDNFFRASHKIVETKEFLGLSLSAKILYFFLCKLRNRYADEEGIFYRSERMLLKDSNLSLASIRRARKELLQKGFIKWKKGKSHIACLYQIQDFD